MSLPVEIRRPLPPVDTTPEGFRRAQDNLFGAAILLGVVSSVLSFAGLSYVDMPDDVFGKGSLALLVGTIVFGLSYSRFTRL